MPCCIGTRLSDIERHACGSLHTLDTSEPIVAAAVSRDFDMASYQQRYVALEIFYLGWNYHGFASQADKEDTIEVSTCDVFLLAPTSTLLSCQKIGGSCDRGAYSQRCGRRA